MSTRDSIIQVADQLIRHKGYNAFSFYDIAKALGIKNASIHYYFPGKAQLGAAVIKEHLSRFNAMRQAVSALPPCEKLRAFISSYCTATEQGNICIVGSLTTDLYTLGTTIEEELRFYAQQVLTWLEGVLDEGLRAGGFAFAMPVHAKALMIITSLAAALQLSRVTCNNDFYTVTETIMQELGPVQPKESNT